MSNSTHLKSVPNLVNRKRVSLGVGDAVAGRTEAYQVAERGDRRFGTVSQLIGVMAINDESSGSLKPEAANLAPVLVTLLAQLDHRAA